MTNKTPVTTVPLLKGSLHNPCPDQIIEHNGARRTLRQWATLLNRAPRALFADLRREGLGVLDQPGRGREVVAKVNSRRSPWRQFVRK